jgi:hypothetical protein
VFRVIFSVSYPIDDPNNNMTLLGSKKETGDVLMLRKPGAVDWMHSKYGDDTNFY